jgi:hypothetical protein
MVEGHVGNYDDVHASYRETLMRTIRLTREKDEWVVQ